MSGPASADEQRGYQKGYAAGRRRHDRESTEAAARTQSVIYLFECLVEGLVLQGVSLDAVLDAQMAGARARVPS